MTADILTLVTGANGGSHALAFGLGCVSTWAFSQRTVVKTLKDRLERQEQRCDARISALEKKYDSLQQEFIGLLKGKGN